MIDSFRPRSPSQESLFLDLIQRLDRLRAGRLAVHIHLAKLSKAYSREKYLRIAAESFASYVSGIEGHLFSLQTGDLIFVSKDATTTNIETAVSRIQMLFSQDPLLETRDGHGQPAFATWYDVEKQYDAILALARDILKEAEKKRDIEASPLFERPKQTESVRPDLLTKVEASLETVDVTNLARRQPVCTLLDIANPQPLFEEVFLSIEDLQNIFIPGVDLSANTWLFRYLTQTLDKRLMLMLIRDGVSTSRPFSINLNVATVLTPEFKKFEDVIAPQLKGRLVIEMNKLDVFADMGAFIFARDYLHDHGFRLCLDGLTHHTLRYYDRGKLGFDLVKLFWAPSALDTMLPSQIPEVRNIIMDTGQAHTILCRCDDERAIQTGQELGIVMFQGRQIDRLMVQSRTQSHMPPQPPRRLRV